MNRSLFAAAFLLALFCAARPCLAGKIKVGQGGIATIQAAVAAALQNDDPVDTVLIPPGTYDEEVFITLTGTPTQQKLTLQSSGKGQVLIRGNGNLTSAIVVQDAKNVTLSKLVLQSGASGDGVPALRISGQTANVVVSGVDGVPGDDAGVAVTGSGTLGARLENCDFTGMTTVAFAIDGNGHSLSKCIADGSGENGFLLSATSTNCVIENSSAQGGNPVSATHPGVVTVRGSGHRLEKVSAQGGSHVFFFEGAGHRVVKCTASGATAADGAGFYAVGVPAQFDACTAKNNVFGFEGGADGQLIDGGAFSDNVASGVRLNASGANLRNLKADGNGGHGVWVTELAERSTLTKNSFKSNGGEGVLVEGSRTFLDGNKAAGGDGFVDAGDLNGGRDNKTSGGAVNDFP